MLRIILPFLLSCNNELLFCLNTAYGKDFTAILTIREMKSILCLLNILTAKSDVPERPYFGDNARNITALANESVTLKCMVKNKGNRTVRQSPDDRHDCAINQENIIRIPSGFMDKKTRSRNSHIKYICLHDRLATLRDTHSRFEQLGPED